jgi:hypothetical protein
VDSVLEHPAATHQHSAHSAAGAHVDAGVVAARWLRISVTRGRRIVVQVCFPSYAVLSLAELVPDDVRTRVIAEHVDLEAVAAEAAARGCPPGDLFAVTAGEHGVRAWLE